MIIARGAAAGRTRPSPTEVLESRRHGDRAGAAVEPAACPGSAMTSPTALSGVPVASARPRRRRLRGFGLAATSVVTSPRRSPSRPDRRRAPRPRLRVAAAIGRRSTSTRAGRDTALGGGAGRDRSRDRRRDPSSRHAARRRGGATPRRPRAGTAHGESRSISSARRGVAARHALEPPRVPPPTAEGAREGPRGRRPVWGGRTGERILGLCKRETGESSAGDAEGGRRHDGTPVPRRPPRAAPA